MPIGGHRRVHVVPFGVERDRIVRPVVEYDADRVVLLDYFTHPVPARPALEAVAEPLEAADIEWTRRELEVGDIFDAMAAVWALIADHGDDEVYVNLATGSKPVTIGAMLACMTTGARPYYVTAERHGSHQGSIQAGIESVRAVPSYPMERPSDQQLRVMAHVADSDRTTVDGTTYRIKSELIDFGDRAELPFLADYAGETVTASTAVVAHWSGRNRRGAATCNIGGAAKPSPRGGSYDRSAPSVRYSADRP